MLNFSRCCQHVAFLFEHVQEVSVLDPFKVFHRGVKDIQVLFPQGILLVPNVKLISFKFRHCRSHSLTKASVGLAIKVQLSSPLGGDPSRK
jgi:hypothetical protein